MRNPPIPRGTDNARLVCLIETVSLKGAGTEKDPVREVNQYWDFEGNLVAVNDPIGGE